MSGAGSFAGIHRWRSSLKPKLIAFLVILALVLVVTFQNTREVVVYFLFWSARTNQILLILIMLIFGFALGFLTGKLTGRKKQ